MSILAEREWKKLFRYAPTYTPSDSFVVKCSKFSRECYCILPLSMVAEVQLRCACSRAHKTAFTPLKSTKKVDLPCTVCHTIFSDKFCGCSMLARFRWLMMSTSEKSPPHLDACVWFIATKAKVLLYEG